MFGLFTDNKPKIIDAIKQSIESEISYVELLKEEIVSEVKKGNRPSYLMYADGGGFPGKQKHKKDSIRLSSCSSREMLQALNKISPNATYDAVNDYAKGDVDNYHISIMRRMGSIHIMASLKTKQELFKNLIEENGGSLF